MIRIAVIGDFHFRESNETLTNQAWNSIMATLFREKLDLVVLLGDFFDRFNTCYQGSFMRVYKALEQATNLAPVVILKGNHECINDNVYLTDSSFLYPARWHPKITVVDNKAHTLRLGEYLLGFVPYVPCGRFREALQTSGHNADDFKAIFSHQDIYGSEIYEGKYSKSGDCWDGCLVVNGHMHIYGRPQRNVVNVGTPYQQWPHEKDEKGITIFELLPTTGGEGVGWREIRLPVQYIRMYSDTITPDRLASYVIPVNHQVKLKVRATRAEWEAINASPVVQALRAQGVVVELKPIAVVPTQGKFNRCVGVKLPPLSTFVETELAGDEAALREFRRFAGVTSLTGPATASSMK